MGWKLSLHESTGDFLDLDTVQVRWNIFSEQGIIIIKSQKATCRGPNFLK